MVPIMVAICALCPQAWTAPVVRSCRRMVGHDKRVQLAQHGHRGAGRVAGEHPFHPRQRQVRLEGNSERSEARRDLSAVRVSLNPSSGCRKMSSARAIKLSAC